MSENQRLHRRELLERIAALEQREAELLRADAELREVRERYELAVQGSSDGIWDWELRTDRVHYADRFKELLGYAPAEVSDDLDFFINHLHEEDRDRVLAQLRDHFEIDVPFWTEFRLRCKDGSYRWFQSRGTCRRNKAGVATRMAGSIADITERREAERAMRQSQDTYRDLFETIRDGILITDLHGRVLQCNPAFLRLMGYELDEMKTLSYQAITPPEWAAQDRRAVVQCLERGYSDTWEKEYLRKDGVRIPVEVRVWLADRSPDGERQLLGLIRDISERKLAEQRIRRLAFFDSLTGLPNRQLFQSRLEEALEEASEVSEEVAVLFVDLDRFKQVNDSLGHSAGDQLLTAVARRFGETVRKDDLVARAGEEGDHFSVSRLGGDEFTLVLRVKNEREAAAVADRLQRVLREPFRINAHEVFVGASIGIAMFPRDGSDAETLIRNADTAMYAAKEQGRGVHQFYSESMNAMGLRRLETEASLRRALENDRLEVHFQPQRDAVGGEICGCEALVRWPQDDGSQISPVEFIPIAEETGLIIALGEWVLRETCRAARDWQDAGYAPLPVSINVSARQFRADDFPDQLEAVLRETGIDPGLVELEITESAFMVDEKKVVTAFHRIKELGVRIALDDFGTGYSALSYLRRFPMDRVKIDRSFVREIITNPSDRALIGAIISMVHTLGMKIVAEGVEELEQAEILRGLDCDVLQGYLISRPLPRRDFERYLLREKDRS